MQHYHRNYIMLGLGWIVVGMALGIWLGITNQQNYGNSHAHVGLLGFVASTLFGLLHWAYPALARSRLALWQFIIYEVGVVILVVGKFLIDGGKETVLLPIGALITIAGAAMMLAMFAKHGHRTA
jgi:peptidoglycan/LPS O-acetylase OafA/YrhL